MNQTLDRVLLCRPLALVAGAFAAALVNPALQTGPFMVWLGLALGSVTLGLYLLRRISGLGRFAVLASPVVGILGWGIYATLTGSLKSPFMVAFILEIAFAAISMGTRGVIGVTVSCLAMIAVMRIPFGWVVEWQLHLLESLFIIATGLLGVAIARRRRAGEVALQTQGLELGSRLESLQRELEDERVVSRVGENVARLAHGLKNTVHSLRGFVSLIEPQLGEGAGPKAALAGLRTAIDDLEKLARLTLAEEEGAAMVPLAALDPSRAANIMSIVEKAHAELSSASPAVRWTVQAPDEAHSFAVPIGESTLLELLVILMRNAVEAMSGEGHGEVRVSRSEQGCLLSVQDEGPGFAPEDLAKIFQPGYTTKAKGSGFGLFLARRIVEDAGGQLDLAAAETGGALVRVVLPLCATD